MDRDSRSPTGVIRNLTSRWCGRYTWFDRRACLPASSATREPGTKEASLTLRLEQTPVQAGVPAGARSAGPIISAKASSALLPISPLLRDFLEWVAGAPRSYAEAMDAWRSSCPRFTIWEDALGERLVALKRGVGPGSRETTVVLTARGWAMLSSR